MEISRFSLAQSDFLDMGILIQNNKDNGRRMMFYKVVNERADMRQREVFLMGVYED
jgi:hypothetical protein